MARSLLGVNNEARTPVSTAGSEAEIEDALQEHDETVESEVGRGLSFSPSKKAPILGLPSPSDSLDSVDDNRNLTQAPRMRKRWTKVLKLLIRHRGLLVRLVKSSVLVAKVCGVQFFWLSGFVNAVADVQPFYDVLETIWVPSLMGVFDVDRSCAG